MRIDFLKPAAGRIVAMLLSLSVLVACGTEEDAYDVRSSDYNDGKPKVAVISEGADDSVRLYIAVPTDVTEVEVCLLSGTNCQRTIKTHLHRRNSDRIYFKADDVVTLLSDSRWRILARTALGDVTQDVRIAAMQSGGGIVQNPNSGTMNWKVVLMASDQGNRGSWINAFDNARKKLKEMFQGFGIASANFQELSIRPELQRDGVKATNLQNFVNSVSAMGVAGTNGACLVHMTSHGSRDGFNLGYSRLPPKDLDAALERGCGDRPTVVLISACFSGYYVQDSSGLKKPNRIILTAARHDRTSFGCSPENQYTYWDNCLIEHLQSSTTFKQLSDNVVSCIRRKESGLTPSEPQAFFGANVSEIKIPGK